MLAACDKLDLKSPEQRITSAKADLAARNPKAAEIELKTALQKQPKNIEARLLLADAYLAMHRGADAEVELGLAEQFGAPAAQTLLPRARSYVIQRNFNKVLKDVPATVTGPPDRQADLLEVRGDAQTMLGLRAEAEASYDAALRLRPDSQTAIYGKARIVAQQGRSDEAMRIIDTALAAVPNSAKSLMLKGDILQSEGKYDEAIALYRTAVKATPDDETALVTLASALVAAKQFDAAKVEIDLALKRFPNDPKAQYLLAIMQYNRGDYKGTFDAVQKVTSADPDYAPAIALTAATQYALGSYAGAESNAQRFVGIYPNSIYGRKLLTAILLKEGQPARAMETIAPMLPADLKDAQVYAMAGAAAAGIGDVARSSEYLAKASRLDPGNQKIRSAYGLESLASGNADSAATAFQTVVDSDPAATDMNGLLVLSLVGKKDFAKAIALAQSLIDKNPKSAIYYNILGGAYLAKQDVTDARAAFDKAASLRPEWAPPALNLARLDLTAKHPDDAKKRLTDVIAHDRKNLDVLFMLADIDASHGRGDEARQWLETAAKENPDSIAAQSRLVDFLLANGNAQQAATNARDLVSRRGENVQTLTLLGTAQAAAGQRDAAVATFGKLAGLQPNAAWIQVTIARLEARDGHVAAAQSALAKALALAPDSAEAQISAAELSIRLGRYDDAAKIALQLEKRPETYATARLLTGDIEMGRRHPDSAIKAYQDAFAKTNNSAALIKLHAALAAVGRKQEANDKLAAWIALNKQDVDSRIYMAGFAEVNGDYPTAKRYFQDVLRIDPKNAISLNELAVIATSQNDPAAIGFAERAYAQRPDSAAIADTFGALLVDAGQVDRGKQILEKAVAGAPSNIDLHYHLAVAQAKLGDKEAARSNLRTVLKATGTSPVKADAKKLLADLS